MNPPSSKETGEPPKEWAKTPAERTITLNMLEALTALRYLRSTREAFQTDLVLLEEKFGAHGNGPTQGAIIALAAEIAILDAVTRKLWVAMT